MSPRLRGFRRPSRFAVPDIVPQEISVDDARRRIAGASSPLPAEEIAVLQALGCALAEPLVSPADLPAFTNSAMDGYAVRAADISAAHAQSVRLPVSSSIAAGSQIKAELEPGSCARIMTGAPLPAGADAVVPFEQTTPSDADWVAFGETLPAGANVRFAGEDARAGDQLLPLGTRVRPAVIALLSSLGLATVRVHRKPRVAVLATGDEVIEPGVPLAPGLIWDANSPALAAMIDDLGAVAIPLGIARDSGQELASRFEEAERRRADFLITCGGVSAGDFDLVKRVLFAHGHFEAWSVRMRPGRPLAFGKIGQLPVLGLPGNPAAAAVAFLQFARPAILTMLGVAPEHRLLPEIPVIVRDHIENRGGRRSFARVRVSRCAEGFEARLSGPQGSANVLTSARANGLLVIPEEIERVQPGMRLTAQMPGWSFD